MRTPSPAILVSTLALAVALTGTAGAAGGWINGARIKPHSITAKQIKRHALTRSTLAATLGDAVAVNDPTASPVDTTGPAGPAGPTGAPGLVDPSKLLVVPGGDGNLQANGVITLTASCPAGTFVIGGGYSDMGTAQKVYAISSGPAADGSQAWQVRARNDTPTENQSTLWHAIAYCVVAA